MYTHIKSPLQALHTCYVPLACSKLAQQCPVCQPAKLWPESCPVLPCPCLNCYLHCGVRLAMMQHSKLPPLAAPVMVAQRLKSVNFSFSYAAAVDTATDPKAPRIAKTAEPEDIQKATGLAYLHSSHCLGSGDIMISAMGTPAGKGVGNFVLFDQDLKVRQSHPDCQHLQLVISSHPVCSHPVLCCLVKQQKQL